MNNRTWACVDCGKTYRRPAGVDIVPCAICGLQCEFVHWKIRVPSPKNRKQWLKFWQLYREEQRLLGEYYAGNLKGEITLDILNMRLNNQQDFVPSKGSKTAAVEIARNATKVRKLFLEGYSKSYIVRTTGVSYYSLQKILEGRI